MRAWKQDCFFLSIVSFFLCLPFIPLSIALAEYFAACALSHGFFLCDYIKVIMRYLLRFYLCFLISFYSRFEILFFFFIRHSFMDTWLSRLHWEFENNQFFPLCCFCCCNSDANTQITRSNRMNVFWSRNRCSFFLLLFIFIGCFEFGHKKKNENWTYTQRHKTYRHLYIKRCLLIRNGACNAQNASLVRPKVRIIL